MMKKLIAGMLASCLIFGSYAVMADDSTAESAESTATGTVELNWEDFEAINAAADEDLISQGEFKTYDEIAVKMWVPNVLQEVELTDEDREQGFIAYYQTADEDAAASVVYADVQGMDLETYKAELEKSEDVKEIEDLVVNGIPCVSYDMPEADTTCVSFATEAGYILEFSFKPMSDEGFQSVIAYMGASIQPEETEEAAASEAESAA